MKNSYLIQQGKFRVNTDKKGLDSIAQMDCMGATEFEWGELPKALVRIRENIGEYELVHYSLTKEPSKMVSVFCKKNESPDTLTMIEKIASGEMYFKCSVDFEYWAKPGRFKNYNDFYWDIENDFMFWKFNPEFDQSFKQIIKG